MVSSSETLCRNSLMPPCRPEPTYLQHTQIPMQGNLQSSLKSQSSKTLQP